MGAIEDILKAADDFDADKIEQLLEAGGHSPKSHFLWRLMDKVVLKLRQQVGIIPYTLNLAERVQARDFYGIGLLLRARGAFAHYKKTKEIQKELVPFFDQNGRWYGLGPKKIWESFGEIEREILPPEMRVIKSPTGEEHLLTSYFCEDSGELTINFSSIGGDLHVGNCQKLSAPRLISVSGDVSPVRVTDIEIPKLTQVGGYLHTSKMKAAVFNELESLGGYLDVGMAESLKLPKLTHAGGGISAHHVTEFQAPKLQRVVGSIYAEKVDPKKFVAPSLREIRGSLSIANQSPDALRNFKASQLRSLLKTSRDDETQMLLKKELKRREALEKTIETIQGATIEL